MQEVTCGHDPRETALPEKRRGGVAPRRFKIWKFFRFPLPCFATGCHTLGFKIATAALQPRNDTNLERFCLGNARFLLHAGNFARYRSVSDFNFLIAKVVGFHEKPTTFCVIARRALARPYDRAVKFGHQPSEICFACEMQANARVKWRFRESTDVVSLRDEFETSRYKICFVIQQTYQFCHCEERSDVAILNEAIRHPGTKSG